MIISKFKNCIRVTSDFKEITTKSMSSYANKIWREKGPEQLQLEEMFTNGSITERATAESVRLSCEMFKDFTPKVFAAHFRKTKARFGDFGTVLIIYPMIYYDSTWLSCLSFKY